MKNYILLLFLGFIATLNAQEIMLKVDYIERDKTNWCAAAASKCVLDYYKKLNNQGKKYSQCAIMEYVRGVVGSYYGYSGCCTPDPPGFEHPCNKGVVMGYNNEKGSIKDILITLGNIPCVKSEFALPTYAIEDNLTQNRLLVAHLKYHFPPFGSPEAHTVVIHGIKNQNLIYTIYYMNPSPQISQTWDEDGGGLLYLPLTEFTNNPKWVWWGTLAVTNCSRSDLPCHCYNLEKDGDEADIDCGGSCWPCPYPDHCYNKQLDADKGEIGIDCGGPCPKCPYPDHCYNGVQDTLLLETGIDCGGPCPACPTLPDPKKCSNCEWDPGEIWTDCGGPCPPCEDLQKEKIVTGYIHYNIMAAKKITTSGYVAVVNGTNVSFITEEDGTIILNPGFITYPSCTFTTQMKDLSKYSRACPDTLCTTAELTSGCYRDLFQPLVIWDLLYAVKIEYEIYDEKDSFIYRNVFDIDRNGRFELWDCITGAIITQGEVTYTIYYSVTYCNEDKIDYTHQFRVADWEHKSSTEAPGDPETPDPILSPPPNNITLQDENTTPSFVIIPNPNPGTFQIETNFPLSQISNLKIINSLGATVYETQNLPSTTIQLPTFASGQHFVTVILKDGTVLTQKMMLQR